MAEFDDKLNSILGNPDAMAQIMQLAQSLGGGGSQTAPPPPPFVQPQPQQQQPPPSPPPSQPQVPSPLSSQGGGDILSSLAGSIDPKLLLKLMPVIQELSGPGDSNARQLLYALRPYLKPERQEKVERALQLARLFHLGKKFLSEWEG